MHDFLLGSSCSFAALNFPPTRFNPQTPFPHRRNGLAVKQSMLPHQEAHELDFRVKDFKGISVSSSCRAHQERILALASRGSLVWLFWMACHPKPCWEGGSGSLKRDRHVFKTLFCRSHWVSKGPRICRTQIPTLSKSESAFSRQMRMCSMGYNMARRHCSICSRKNHICRRRTADWQLNSVECAVSVRDFDFSGQASQWLPLCCQNFKEHSLAYFVQECCKAIVKGDSDEAMVCGKDSSVILEEL